MNVSMSQPKISIVIPVYNGGEYLKKLVYSLETQTFRDFEVVLVEDSSTDDSMTFLQNEAQKDKRLKVIQRPQKGGNGTKNVFWGLPYCEGAYFLYMSQDDLIEKDTLEKLYNKAVQTGADIVVPNMVWYFEDGVDHGGLYYNENDEMDPIKAFLSSLKWELHGFNLRKMDLIKKVGFDDMYYNSDEYATRIHYFYANKIVFCKTKFFYRQNNPNAITKGDLKPFKFEMLPSELRLVDFMIKHHLEKEKEFSKFTIRLSRIYRRFASSPLVETFDADCKASVRKICLEFRQEFLKLAFESKKTLFILRALRLYLIRVK